jgi:hypothetical protein
MTGKNRIDHYSKKEKGFRWISLQVSYSVDKSQEHKELYAFPAVSGLDNSHVIPYGYHFPHNYN